MRDLGIKAEAGNWQIPVVHTFLTMLENGGFVKNGMFP